MLHSKREERGKEEGHHQSNVCFQFDKSTYTPHVYAILQYSAVPVGAIDQENTERQGKCVLCPLTFAKRQRRYVHNQNDWHWSPQTTGHVCLHIHFDQICESIIQHTRSSKNKSYGTLTRQEKAIKQQQQQQQGKNKTTKRETANKTKQNKIR